MTRTTYINPNQKLKSGLADNQLVPLPHQQPTVIPELPSPDPLCPAESVFDKMSDAVDSILEQITELSFPEMLQLNASLALLLKKGGKGGAVSRALKKEKKAKDPDAPKRQAATGTLAWIAFVKKIKEEHPDLFVDCTKEPERLAVVKDYRAENKEEYEEFVKTYKEEAAAEAADSDEDDETPAPPVKKPAAPAKKPTETKSSSPKTAAAAKEDKLAAVRALAEKKKIAASSKTAGGGAAAAAAPAKKEVKKAVSAPKTPAAPKKEEEEDESMGKITVEGTEYWMDKKTNGLYTLEEGDGFGPWVGYYQPETEDIRHTDAPEEE